MWRPGSKLIHPFNPELGVGTVLALDGRFLRVYFPAVERELTLAADGGGFSRLVMAPGARARLAGSDEEVRVARALDHRYLLIDGREVDDADLWPLDPMDSPLERLVSRQLDPIAAFRNRVEGLRLRALREAGGLGSFLGGRIELFPHQLHTALRAVAQDPVRWLLADEVGLGKTIEACLITSALIRTHRTESVLIIAPDTLVVQWLGELYRKFHQIFVLLDPVRLESVASDYGPEVNPFEVHPLAVISLELLGSDPRLIALALEARPELVVIDEAHRLADPARGSGVTPLVSAARHALLLTATPLYADRRGFFELLRLLQPDRLGDFATFNRDLDRGVGRVDCTSAVRRSDLGNLPERRPTAVVLPARSEELVRDPRTGWLAERVRTWFEAREKALVFIDGQARLEELKTFLEGVTRTRMMVFHEGLSMGQRDIEVANFRESRAPLLLCTDAGTEGRNFQFCERMVHFDLPADPTVLEQRIGRLDRIGRKREVEIIYFRQPEVRPDLASLYEELDLFGRPSAGLDAALDPLRARLRAAVEHSTELDVAALVEEVRAASGSGVRDAPRVLYRDAYDATQDAELLARVPPDLELRTRLFCLEAARELGLKVIEKGERARYYLELGEHAKVDSLPGVPGGSRYLGTFDRAEAVRRDEIDFFASGHPLLEALLLEMEDGPRGRACAFELPGGGMTGAGLLGLYAQGPGWRTVIVGLDGRLRPEWEEQLLIALPAATPLDPESLGLAERWAEAIRVLGRRADEVAKPERALACAVFRLC